MKDRVPPACQSYRFKIYTPDDVTLNEGIGSGNEMILLIQQGSDWIQNERVAVNETNVFLRTVFNLEVICEVTRLK